jgi:hypothetical protein
MSRMRKRVSRLSALVLVGLLALSGAALAATSLSPQLRSPVHGKKFVAGHKIKFTVYIPNPAIVVNGDVFLNLSDKKIVKHGELGFPRHCGFRCNNATMKRVGHTHLWTYTDPYHFPGNWQDTPGRYYWQAFYYSDQSSTGTFQSVIGTLRVIR